MINIRRAEAAPEIPKDVAIDVVREWVRNAAPDIRLRTRRLDDGTRGCSTRFTFRGELLFTESLESATNPNPDDDVWRRSAWIIHVRLGVRTELASEERAQLEAEIVRAAHAGKTEQADALGRELALRNEGIAVGPVRTQFTDFGGSMFQGDRTR